MSHYKNRDSNFSISKKLQDADNLSDDYQSSFGDNYEENTNILSKIKNIDHKKILSSMLAAKTRLFIVFCVCFILMLFILSKLKPKFMINPKASIIEQKENKLNIEKLLGYSVLFGFVLFCIIIIISHYNPQLKELIFKEDCSKCNE